MVTIDYIVYNLAIKLYMLWIFSDIALAFARATLLVYIIITLRVFAKYLDIS
jgi:hypothetical protein